MPLGQKKGMGRRLRNNSTGWKIVFVLVALIALAVAAWGVQRWLWPANTAGAELTAAVSRGDLPIVVTERGDLESSKTITVKCDVEFSGEQQRSPGLKIVSILPEGTRVTKGQVVVELDTDKLKRTLAEQEVKYNTARGKYEAARQELEVQKNKAESETAKAQLAQTLAKLDFEKYVRGEYLADLDEKKGAIKLAEKELQDAEEKLKHYQTFVKKGFGTPEQLRLKELEVERARNFLERDKAKLTVLETYTKARQEAELEFKAEDAKREVVRVKNGGDANVSKAKADMDSARVVADLERTQFEQLKKQLEFAVIKAPADGILVYAQSRFWDPDSRIQLGAVVMYQQAIFQLPELDHMQVKVRVHESKVKKLRVGQKAEIRVEALSNRVLHGTVKTVATLADMAMSWRRGGIKEYETIVTIDDLPSDAALKPNMTAEVTIKVDQVNDVLLVPVQAVAEIEGQHYAYVATNSGIERREVTVDKSNDKYVQVQSGLEQGERVHLDARKRAAEEAKASGAKEGPAKEGPPKIPAAEPRS
jgi:RND family efflux transporter MFP subunit